MISLVKEVVRYQPCELEADRVEGYSKPGRLKTNMNSLNPINQSINPIIIMRIKITIIIIIIIITITIIIIII